MFGKPGWPNGQSPKNAYRHPSPVDDALSSDGERAEGKTETPGGGRLSGESPLLPGRRPVTPPAVRRDYRRTTARARVRQVPSTDGAYSRHRSPQPYTKRRPPARPVTNAPRP
ncbi:Hypothetical protein CINCED_3A005339 [Cinara cedri]|uniref:Uncharacterized protein n=1 Tax=Cinara cedri TaxID=506608 RepID=A0A5E4MEG6_9HEMI|nr:Hypothetical protein CINCED_3A005339 [Cinara cedri]